METSPSMTVRDTLSTCVVALTSTVPNVSLALAPERNASALRNTIALPVQLTTCGGYTSAAPSPTTT